MNHVNATYKIGPGTYRRRKIYVGPGAKLLPGFEKALAKKPLPHTKDEDCTVGADDCCTECGVYHGDECPTCHGLGFHKDGCAEMERAA